MPAIVDAKAVAVGSAECAEIGHHSAGIAEGIESRVARYVISGVRPSVSFR